MKTCARCVLYQHPLRASYLLIDDSGIDVRRVEYDLDRARHDAVKAAFPIAEWLAKVQREGRFISP
jgi:hypothetical protein